MKISFCIPSRNGQEFLEWSYNSIRKNQGDHFVEILVLDDISDKDNTWEWCLKMMKTDSNFKAFQNKRKERLGISGGYKFLAQQATQEIIVHWHNDMNLLEGVLDDVEAELFENERVDIGYGDFWTNKKPLNKNVVCLTRIEPPIYGEGLFKIVWKDAPVELDDWDEDKFLNFLPEAKKLWNDRTTGGHFAPFFMFREEYNRIGGVDSETFKFQAREDSCFGFRLILDGFETIQIPSFCFHWASRGNRRAKHTSGSYRDNPEWIKINQISERNFIRKWGTFEPLHDDWLTPRKPVKYNIGFTVLNCNYDLLYLLEPWCDVIWNDLNLNEIAKYCQEEQPNTKFDIESRIAPELGDSDKFKQSEIQIEIDGHRFNQDDYFYIKFLSQIISQKEELGEFELGNLKITINAMNHYENDLIVCKNEPINLND